MSALSREQEHRYGPQDVRALRFHDDHKMEHSSESNSFIDDDDDEDENDISFEPQLQYLEQRIAEKEHSVRRLQERLNREIADLSAMQSEADRLRREQRQRHRQRDLIDAERARLERQQREDHEVALRLQAREQREMRIEQMELEREADMRRELEHIQLRREQSEHEEPMPYSMFARRPLLMSSSPFAGLSAMGGRAAFDASGFDAIRRHS